jgi:hypothetical protein
VTAAASRHMVNAVTNLGAEGIDTDFWWVRFHVVWHRAAGPLQT